MSSGVKVSKDVGLTYQEQQMKHKCPFVVYKINNASGEIEVEKKATEEEGFEQLKCCLKEAAEAKECRYVTYDCPDDDECHKGKGAKGNLCLMSWSNDNKALIKNKMLYASSFAEMKKACPGVKKVLELHDEGELDLKEIQHKIKK